MTDESLKHLQPFTSLRVLVLTDEGLERLQALKKLKTLQVVRTRVSENGIREFRKAVPGCEVIK